VGDLLVEPLLRIPRLQDAPPILHSTRSVSADILPHRKRPHQHRQRHRRRMAGVEGGLDEAGETFIGSWRERRSWECPLLA
jgi:hypothetical protein